MLSQEVFNYLTNFLREVFRLKAKSGLDPKTVAPLFASVLLRDPPHKHTQTHQAVSSIKARAEQLELDNRKVMFLSRFVTAAASTD